MQNLSSLNWYRKFVSLVLIACSGILLPRVIEADIRTKALVTVYSEGKVMATYKAINRGHMDDRCYVFKVRKGVRDLEVRVCGTFSVEDVR